MAILHIQSIGFRWNLTVVNHHLRFPKLNVSSSWKVQSSSLSPTTSRSTIIGSSLLFIVWQCEIDSYLSTAYFPHIVLHILSFCWFFQNTLTSSSSWLNFKLNPALVNIFRILHSWYHRTKWRYSWNLNEWESKQIQTYASRLHSKSAKTIRKKEDRVGK